MTSIETYRKQAKQLVRWHRDRNFSVGGKVRVLDRFRDLTDVEILDRPLPLTLAQEVIAVEAGFADWPALKAVAQKEGGSASVRKGAPQLTGLVPVLFVRDVSASAAFYEEKLGFEVDFLHGKPPFYGAVSRGSVCLHLRFVHEPNFATLAGSEPSLILASVETDDVKSLYEEFAAEGVSFAQPLMRQAWGGLDFHVRDPDGNVISFVEYRNPAVTEDPV